MAIFQPIQLSWHSRDFTIPAERVLGAIAVVEEVATFPEIVQMINRNPNMSKVARAYGELLRYAGARVEDDEVYEGLFKPGTTHAQVILALKTMAAMMMPPSAMASLGDGAASEGNERRAPKARSNSSKRSSKRRLAAVG